jgi:hypothetical protein
MRPEIAWRSLEKSSLLGWLGFLERIVIALIGLAWPFTAQALVLNIDTFTATANNTVIQDTFDDGIPPPGGPLGSSSYNAQGTIAAGSEAGGKLTINTANGILTANAIGQPRRNAGATLLTPANSSGVGIDDDISVSGLFDLTTPVGPLFNAYGVQLIDAGPSQPT